MVETKEVIVWMLARCPECGSVNKVVLDWNNPPRFRKCTECANYSPFGAYRVVEHQNNRPEWWDGAEFTKEKERVS